MGMHMDMDMDMDMDTGWDASMGMHMATHRRPKTVSEAATMMTMPTVRSRGSQNVHAVGSSARSE